MPDYDGVLNESIGTFVALRLQFQAGLTAFYGVSWEKRLLAQHALVWAAMVPGTLSLTEHFWHN